MLTARLELRPPDEQDRHRFVNCSVTTEFMIFSGGVLDSAAAHRRFDEMLGRPGASVREATDHLDKPSPT